MIYLDNSATTRPAPQVVKAVTDALCEGFGNPSSLYRLGLEAEKTVKQARSLVAESLGAEPSEIFFTSGGTESDNTALKGIYEARKKQGRRIITTAVEHPAILQCCQWLRQQGADVVLLPVDRMCRPDLNALKEALTEDTILVSVMQVNNETGTIMPLKEIRKILDDAGSKAVFHSDAVQGWGKEKTDVKAMGVDMLSVSGHKIHAPKGIGALYVKKGLHVPVFIHGGGQESGFRSGTENVPGMAGLGAAAKLILDNGEERYKAIERAQKRLRELIISEIPDISINSPEDGCPSVLNVSFKGCRGEVLLHTLDTEGICVSTGSACSSHSRGSHVLSAMGLTQEEIQGAVRFSFCADNTPEEMEIVAECLKKAVTSQRKLKAAFTGSKKH